MFKKGITCIFAILFSLSLTVTAFAQSVSTAYDLRPTDLSYWGQVEVDLPSVDNALYVTVNQWGTHLGQPAHTWWDIVNSSGYVEKYRDLNGDAYVSIIFSNLQNPGGVYDVVWSAMTNNDSEGWYQIRTPSSGAGFYRIR